MKHVNTQPQQPQQQQPQQQQHPSRPDTDSTAPQTTTSTAQHCTAPRERPRPCDRFRSLFAPGKSSEKQDRAQLLTLEGVFAAALLIATIWFVAATLTATPFTAVPSENTHTVSNEQELQSLVDTLTTEKEEEEEEGEVGRAVHSPLGELVMYWDSSTDAFYTSDTDENNGVVTRADGAYTTGFPSDLAVTDAVNEYTTESGSVVNVHVTYQTSDGDVVTRPVVVNGDPGENAVSASSTVTIRDTDTLTAPGNTGTRVTDDPDFYVPDANAESDTSVYNTVTVTVTAWRP